jgi:hypothetical protein
MKFKTLVLTSLACFIVAGCKPEANYANPEIRFAAGPGFLSQDTILMLNDTVNIGIIADTGSDQELTHLHISINRDSVESKIDTALFTKHLEYSRIIVKGIAASETWTFYVRDRARRISEEISLTVGLDKSSQYGRIDSLKLMLGAQENSTRGSFASLTSGKVYTTTEAYANQALIHLVYYYDPVTGDQNTVASPGANIDGSIFSGPEGLANWSIKNTTRFNPATNLTTADFDRCRNDSLILTNTFDFETGKRKAKTLTAGQIYSFVTDSGIQGLFKVNSVTGKQDGTISLTVKMKKK